MKKWKSQERGIDQENVPEVTPGTSSGNSPRLPLSVDNNNSPKNQSSMAFVEDASPVFDNCGSPDQVSSQKMAVFKTRQQQTWLTEGRLRIWKSARKVLVGVANNAQYNLKERCFKGFKKRSFFEKFQHKKSVFTIF